MPIDIVEALADKFGISPRDLLTNEAQLELFKQEEEKSKGKKS